MTKFILKRALLVIPILFGVSVVVFLSLQLVPGDPISAWLGPDSTPDARRILTDEFGLDKPLVAQYLSWIGNVFTGDFGKSIMRQVPVSSMLGSAFGNTLILAVSALLIAIVVGMFLGGIGALYHNKFPGRVSSALSSMSISMPEYSMALILVAVLAVGLNFFPAGGKINPISGGGIGDMLHHLVLPALSASLVPTGMTARMFRASLIEVMSADFIDGMRARGLGRLTILRHAIHNTLPSLFTVTGLQVGYLLGGVTFVETIFSWPGMGLMLYNAITARDYPVIQAGVLLAASCFVIVNALVDSFHAYVDPRIR